MPENKCDNFIAAIGETAVSRGVLKALLQGEHDDDICHLNLLLAVDDIKRFSEKHHAKIAFECISNGVCGAIDARDASDFPKGLEDMAKFYTDTEPVKGYVRNENTLIPA